MVCEYKCDSHLISEGQEVVVGQNRGRCMVIMLQARVRQDCSSPTTRRQYLESTSVLRVISGELGSTEKGRTSPCPSGLSGQQRRGPFWREREGERRRGHTKPESEADKGKDYVGNNHKLTSFVRWLSYFLSGLKSSPLDPRLSSATVF